jgi:hypothetical protein
MEASRGLHYSVARRRDGIRLAGMTLEHATVVYDKSALNVYPH